jgi:hypothetical protein
VEPGPIEAGVVADLAAVDLPGSAGLKATAIRLARTLDEGAGLATAAVARELRATLTALTREDGDDGSDALTALLSAMSTPVLNGQDA